MIEWYQVISYFITNGIKVFLCLFAASELLKATSFDRRIVIVFATATTGDEIPEKYNGLMALLAVVIAFAVTFIIDFNAISRLKSLIQKTKADIESVNETANALIDKAERVADKYRSDETEVYKEFADARKGSKKIRTSKDFKAVMEVYPELQANVHTKKLLNQIETTENAKLKGVPFLSSCCPLRRWNHQISEHQASSLETRELAAKQTEGEKT